MYGAAGDADISAVDFERIAGLTHEGTALDDQRTCVNIDRLCVFVVNFSVGTAVAYGKPAVFADQQRSSIGIVFCPCQRMAVQVEGNISLVKNIVTIAIVSMGAACAAVCCDIRQQLHRGAWFLLRRVKGGDQVGIGRTVHIRHCATFRLHHDIVLYALHGGVRVHRVHRAARSGLRLRVRLFRPRGRGQERQAQGQRHECTQ